jgi:hypothetical protein
VSNRDDEERKLCGGGHTCIVREKEKEKKLCGILTCRF